jgi:hypothetical protein
MVVTEFSPAPETAFPSLMPRLLFSSAFPGCPGDRLSTASLARPRVRTARPGKSSSAGAWEDEARFTPTRPSVGPAKGQQRQAGDDVKEGPLTGMTSVSQESRDSAVPNEDVSLTRM